MKAISDALALSPPSRMIDAAPGSCYQHAMQVCFPYIRCWAAICLSFVVLSVTGGCGNPERADRREERDPLVMRGDARQRAGDLDGAIESYLRALERRPQIALPHVKLGLIYKDRREHLLAIYHLNRYMDMRPTAAKNDMLRQLVIRAQNQYVASLPNPPEGALEEIAMLERENQNLRVEVAELRQQVRELRDAAGRSPGAPPAPVATARPDPVPTAPRPAPAAEATEVRTYVVRRGDMLTRIASRMYNDSTQWRRIYDANRGILQTPDSLREGQELVIP